jgi:uncharacterized OB-fold protein
MSTQSTADLDGFWTACESGRLVVQQCTGCLHAWHIPVERCPECLGARFEWAPASGRGTIYSFVVARRGRFPGFEDRVPYVIALVQLVDHPGVRLFTNIVGCDPSAVRVGAPVRVTFKADSSGRILPLFELEPQANVRRRSRS